MKNLLLSGIIVAFFVLSCNKNEDYTSNDSRTDDPGVFFRTSGGIEYRFEDFDFYDSSAHMFYFREVHEELENSGQHNFVFLENAREIYSGKFWPAYMSSIPSGPFIGSMFSVYPQYAMMIGYIYGDKPDPRNSPDMIRVLRKHNLLHSGLSVTLNNAEVSGNHATVDVTVTNRDVTDLLVLDPGKMGSALFKYFTPGVHVRGPNNEFLAYSHYESPMQEIEDEWSTDWLTKLGQNESLHFTLDYTLSEVIKSDECNVLFTYSGLGREVQLDQLYQGDARVWLGDINCWKTVEVK